MDPYLAPSEWIDVDHPAIAVLAAQLREATAVETARRSFEWVRDEVAHTGDARGGAITCRASDVLAQRTGYCYAKSHLLVALLRANGIRAGLCYQRLSDGERFVLHGLVAVDLAGHGWYRVDPRGNKPGVEARFTPPVEALAWTPEAPGERDLPGVHAAPWPAVVDVLTRCATWDDAMRALPDLEPHLAARVP